METLVCHIGPSLSLTTSGGEPVIVQGTRPLCLLALIALSPEQRVERRWVEATLWSARSPEQASGSLRQLLGLLRRALGKHSDMLKADRRSIWFDPVLRVEEEPDCKSEDFLAGLRIRDQRFENWKADLRRGRTSATPKHLTETALESIIVVAPGADLVGGELIQQTVIQQFLQNIRETTLVQTIVGDREALVCGPNADMSIEVFAGSRPQDSFIALHMKAEPSGATIWSKSIALPKTLPAYDPNGDLAVACFAAANEATDRASHFLHVDRPEVTRETRADAVLCRGIKELFSFGDDCFRRAEQYFIRANAIAPHPVALAWLASVPMVEYNETGQLNREAVEEQHRELISHILSDWPDNGVAMALLSMVELMVNDNLDTAVNLSDSAIRVNPHHPLSPLSVATIALRQNALSRSELFIGKALEVGESSNIRQWWTVQAAMTCIRKKQYDKAVSLATAASLRAPKFRPPLRHLYPLYIMLGQPDRARAVLKQLRTLEPEFSLEYIRSNPSYPASLLRNSPLLELQDIDLLEV